MLKQVDGAGWGLANAKLKGESDAITEAPVGSSSPGDRTALTLLQAYPTPRSAYSSSPSTCRMPDETNSTLPKSRRSISDSRGQSSWEVGALAGPSVCSKRSVRWTSTYQDA